MRHACISKDYRKHLVPFSTQGCVTLYSVHYGVPSFHGLFQWDVPQSLQLKIQPLTHPFKSHVSALFSLQHFHHLPSLTFCLSILYIFCLPHQDNFCDREDFCLFCSLLYPPCLEQHLAHSRYTIKCVKELNAGMSEGILEKQASSCCGQGACSFIRPILPV